MTKKWWHKATESKSLSLIPTFYVMIITICMISFLIMCWWWDKSVFFMRKIFIIIIWDAPLFLQESERSAAVHALSVTSPLRGGRASTSRRRRKVPRRRGSCPRASMTSTSWRSCEASGNGDPCFCWERSMRLESRCAAPSRR